MKSRSRAWLIVFGLLILLTGVWLFVMMYDSDPLPADDVKPVVQTGSNDYFRLLDKDRKLSESLSSSPIRKEDPLSLSAAFDPEALRDLLTAAPVAESMLDEALKSSRWIGSNGTLQTLRAITRCLMAKALAEAENGSGKAVEPLEKLIRALSRCAASEDGSMIYHMHATIIRLWPMIARCAEKGAFSDAELQRLQIAFESIIVPESSLAEHMRRRCWTLREKLLVKGQKRKDILFSTLEKTVGRPAMQFKPAATADLLADRTRRLIGMTSRIMNGESEALKALIEHLRHRPPAPALNFNTVRSWLVPNALGEAVVAKVDFLWPEASEWLDAASMRECLIAVIACERFRLAHNRLPASLDDLVPAFLPSPRKDPWTGGPLEYRLEERVILSAGTRFAGETFSNHWESILAARFSGSLPDDTRFHSIFVRLLPIDRTRFKPRSPPETKEQ